MKKIALLVLISCGFAAHAADNLKFHGTLIAPPNCTISNDQTIEIEFGNVLINKIDGTNYAKDVPYTITCDSTVRDDSMAMTLTLSGSATSFNQAAIGTTVTGLGPRCSLALRPYSPQRQWITCIFPVPWWPVHVRLW